MTGAAIFEITDNNREQFKKVVLATYLGEKCVCGHEFKHPSELEGTVYHPRGNNRISHKACFNKHTGKDNQPIKEEHTMKNDTPEVEQILDRVQSTIDNLGKTSKDTTEEETNL